MNGRWAPNTLARKYDYNDFVQGKGEAYLPTIMDLCIMGILIENYSKKISII